MGGGGGLFLGQQKQFRLFSCLYVSLLVAQNNAMDIPPSKQTSHEHNPQASKNLTSTTRVYINYRLLDTDTLPYHLAQRMTSCKLITVFLRTKTKTNTKQQRERERETPVDNHYLVTTVLLSVKTQLTQGLPGVADDAGVATKH